MRGDPLEFVAVDIETTGFESDAEVTVVGFARQDSCHVFCQAREAQNDNLHRRVNAQVDSDVTVTSHESETALLRAVIAFVDERLQNEDVLLVAYNGERYRGGFDLPFLRTRYAAHQLEWPFADLPYADLLPVIRDRFNTSVDGDAQDDLVGAYRVLVDEGLNALDPFSDSAEAVAAFEDGDLKSLVLHNVADILRTAALGELSQRYCSKSDYQLKSLTPTKHDQP